VATDSRIGKMIGLFCRIMSLLQGSVTKETYNFINSTNQSHPISPSPSTWCVYVCACACACVCVCVIKHEAVKVVATIAESTMGWLRSVGSIKL